jgi:DtxR family Mn-dependent transcriptional regulator
MRFVSSSAAYVGKSMSRLSAAAGENCGGCTGKFGSSLTCSKMAAVIKPLRRSKEHYIIAVYELQKNGVGARITDIALMLGVSKPSTHSAVRELQAENLVTAKRYGCVYLTAEGRRQALFILCKYATIKRFLTEVIKVTEQTATLDAGQLVHCISNETLTAFNRRASTLKGVNAMEPNNPTGKAQEEPA